MYCVKCGVRLAESEERCPLCQTRVCHPDFMPRDREALYPVGRMPKRPVRSKALCGALIILFLIPLLVCFFADLSLDGKIEWFGYVAGALVLAYIVAALPLWFERPNAVIFVPCDFAAAALYLLYIDLATRGGWFMGFALPVIGGLCLITCAVVTLMRSLRRGRLYIFGGAFMALGAMMPLMEFLMVRRFALALIGWSVYPLVVLFLFGAMLIFLAINKSAREILERKLFF